MGFPGLSIDDDDEGLGDDDDLPPLEEVEGAADEASKMEDSDIIECGTALTTSWPSECDDSAEGLLLHSTDSNVTTS